MIKPLASIMIIAFICGCSAPARNTPSGKPEITLSKAPIDGAKALITNRMLNHGYRIVSDSRYSLVFGKRGPATLGIPAEWGYKASFTLVEQGSGGVRVVADLKMVLNEGTPFERDWQQSPPAATTQQIDGILSELRAKYGA